MTDSDVGSSVSQRLQESPAAKTASATSGLVGQFKVANDNNMAVIKREAEGQLELQTLLLGHISTYKMELRQAQEMGCKTVAEACAQGGPKKRKVPAAIEISPDEVIRRGQFYYVNWNAKMLNAAMNFMDEVAMPMTHLKQLSLEVKKEAFERATNLRLTGDQVDKIAKVNKLDCFSDLRTCYVENGRVWRSLVWSGFSIDWADPKNGVFRRAIVDGKIMIHCVHCEEPKELTAEVIGNDAGPFDVIVWNHSLRAAHFQTRKGTYNLSQLFPTLSRTLRRRVSEEVLQGGPPANLLEAQADVAAQTEESTGVALGESAADAPPSPVAPGNIVLEEAPPPPPE